MPSAQVIKITPRHNQRNLEEFTAAFKAAVKKSIEGILDSCQILLDAKEQIEYGRWTQWIEQDLGIGVRQAQMMIFVAKNKAISSHTNHGSLPPSWRTLYELALIKPQRLGELIAKGKVHSAIMREEVVALRLGEKSSASTQDKVKSPKVRKELIPLIQACLVLAGSDVVVGYIRGLQDWPEAPTLNDFQQASAWAKETLRKRKG